MRRFRQLGLLIPDLNEQVPPLAQDPTDLTVIPSIDSRKAAVVCSSVDATVVLPADEPIAMEPMSPDSRQPERPSVEKISEIAIPILVIHLIALLAFVPAFWSWTNLIALLAGTLVFGQGVNLGYHRILSHKSLSVPKWLEYFYVVLALCSLEESPGKWVSTHRRHHKHSDRKPDPHSPTQNLFWSHLGWLLISRDGQQEFRQDDQHSPDIMKDPFYRLLEKHPLLPGLIFLAHAALVFLTAWAIYFALGFENGAWLATGLLLWGVFLRTVVVWHITWSVNSLGHLFGYQNYETGEGSRNNWLVALLSSGEGWHNNHHHDSASACNQHRWWEVDLTWYHIRLLEITGLARNVVRPRHIRQRRGQGTNAP